MGYRHFIFFFLFLDSSFHLIIFVSFDWKYWSACSRRLMKLTLMWSPNIGLQTQVLMLVRDCQGFQTSPMVRTVHLIYHHPVNPEPGNYSIQNRHHCLSTSMVDVTIRLLECTPRLIEFGASRVVDASYKWWHIPRLQSWLISFAISIFFFYILEENLIFFNTRECTVEFNAAGCTVVK